MGACNCFAGALGAVAVAADAVLILSVHLFACLLTGWVFQRQGDPAGSQPAEARDDPPHEQTQGDPAPSAPHHAGTNTLPAQTDSPPAPGIEPTHGKANQVPAGTAARSMSEPMPKVQLWPPTPELPQLADQLRQQAIAALSDAIKVTPQIV